MPATAPPGPFMKTAASTTGFQSSGCGTLGWSGVEVSTNWDSRASKMVKKSSGFLLRLFAISWQIDLTTRNRCEPTIGFGAASDPILLSTVRLWCEIVATQKGAHRASIIVRTVRRLCDGHKPGSRAGVTNRLQLAPSGHDLGTEWAQAGSCQMAEGCQMRCRWAAKYKNPCRSWAFRGLPA